MLATAVSIVVVVLSSVAMMLLLDYETGWNWSDYSYHGFWTPTGFVRNLFFNGWHPVFPWLGFLLFGIILSRLSLAGSSGTRSEVVRRSPASSEGTAAPPTSDGRDSAVFDAAVVLEDSTGCETGGPDWLSAYCVQPASREKRTRTVVRWQWFISTSPVLME